VYVGGVGDLPPFLDDFVRFNLLQKGIDPGQSEHVQGVDFAFVTSSDLVGITAGFTQSAFNVPATIYLTGNTTTQLPEPEHVPSLLAGCLLLAQLSRRRAALCCKRGQSARSRHAT
jgi:hypothetical protein